MSELLCVYNGKVVLPNRVLSNGAVLIRDDRIESIFDHQPDCTNARMLDAQGKYILAGFIDLHLHGGGGSDFMDGTPDAFRNIARTHLIHGTTAMTPTAMTGPDEELERFILAYRQVKKEGTGGAQFLGLHLEGPYFSTAAKGAQPIVSIRTPDLDFVEHILDLGGEEIRRWDAAPELPGMETFAALLKSRGVLISIAHSDAIAQEAEAAFTWGFSHITHFYNAVTTFRKIRGRVCAGIVEAAYINDDITIELIGDGRHIPRESMLLAWRIKGADRIALITDAMRAAGTQDTASVLGSLESGVPVVVEDGVAHLADKRSFAGSICTMDRALRVAHLDYGLPIEDVSRMLSLTPARLCGMDKQKGSIEVGKHADLVILDERFRVRYVLVMGKLCFDACEAYSTQQTMLQVGTGG